MTDPPVWMRCNGCARWFYGAFQVGDSESQFCVLCTPPNQARERTQSPVLRKAS